MKDALKQLAARYKMNRQTLLFAAGMVGILLIALSSAGGKKVPAEKNEAPPAPTAESYAQDLESRLTAILREVEGVGEARVMVTLTNGYGYVYAKEEKTNRDTLEDSKDQESKKTQEKTTTEESYILVDGPNGEEPLVTSQIPPEIRGVVVVCQGASNPAVAVRVMETVTVALDIPSTRVTVCPLAAG